jgi:hypothetical protein
MPYLLQQWMIAPSGIKRDITYDTTEDYRSEPTMNNIRNAIDKAVPIVPLEYLAFTLGQEEYGIDIQKVQALRGYDAVT